MAREAGKRSFLDFFKEKDIEDDYDDEFDDDLFADDEEEDEEDEYYTKPKSRNSYSKPKPQLSSRTNQERNTIKTPERNNSYNVRPQTRNGTGNGKLVEFNGRKAIKSKMNGEVYVIQPRDIEDTDIIVDNLLDGYVIIINLEGVEISTAQRIVDFVGGATKAIDGSIVPITGSIFVATAYRDSVTGNVRDEIAGGMGSASYGYNY